MATCLEAWPEATLVRVPSFETPYFARLLRMRSETLSQYGMVLLYRAVADGGGEEA